MFLFTQGSNQAHRGVVGLSMLKFKERICCIYYQRCSLCMTYCYSKAFLCREKSSCPPPWCAECRLSWRWWTVGLWTTGSSLCSVTTSQFCYLSLCVSGTCKRKQYCLSLFQSWLHLSVCLWSLLSMQLFWRVFLVCSRQSIQKLCMYTYVCTIIRQSIMKIFVTVGTRWILFP